MSATALESPRRTRIEAPIASMSASELAELVSAFNEAAAGLQRAHESLQSEVRRLETELRDTKEQLERANRLASLGEMAAGIAHEVRNPLGSIKLYASVLITDLADRPPECAIATKIAGAVDRLNAVVGDVLAFSRQVRVSPARLSISSLFDEAIESCRGCFTPALTIERRDTESDLVWCDANLVHQALVNIIRNAVEAMTEYNIASPRLTFDAAHRRILSAEGDRRSMVALIIQDNGPGVPAEVMHRIFNPFFTTRETGTGLGLAIVHRIMDAHAGRVTIRNSVPANETHSPGAITSGGACVELLFPGMDAGEAADEITEGQAQ